MDADDVEDHVFPEIGPRWLGSATFKLLYRQHGGSGLGLTKAEVEGMDVDELLWWLEHLDEVRENESSAIEKAQNE